jgi:hypothetical protein
VLHSLGAPLGEPVADDYDFLHHAFLSGGGDWLDGGGSLFYWRPLARQLYYRLLGPMMLAHPAWIALLQAVFVGLAALLLYRALRVRWPASWAATAATFPFLTESARMLIATPTNFQDLGSLLLASAALHEASRRRPWTALAALLGSLLCKEMGVVTALLLPWMPPVRREERRVRLLWTGAALAVVLAWGLAYLAVARQTGQHFARDLFDDPAVLAKPWLERFGWAIVRSWRDAASLSSDSSFWTGPLLATWGVLAGATLIGLAVSHRARTALRSALPWVAWGYLWFLGATATLADVYPEWRSYRSAFALFGLGVAGAPLLGAVHPWLLALLLVVRLGAFAASPGPPNGIGVLPDASAAGINYSELVRLQRFVGETRRLLLDAHPQAPAGARIGRHYFPRLAIYAFGDDRAPQVWYRDTTVRWQTASVFLADTAAPPLTIVEFQPRGTRQVALVDPDAARALLMAANHVGRAEWNEALALLAHADSLQPDSAASVFFGISAGKRALALAAMGRQDDAEREAERAIRFWMENNEPRYILAYGLAQRGRLEQAAAQLDTLLLYHPDDEESRKLYREVLAARTRRGATPPPGH